MGNFIGGSEPSIVDILSYCYLYPLFTTNQWLSKKYAALRDMFNTLLPNYIEAQKRLGEQEIAKASKQAKTVVHYTENAVLNRIKSENILP